MARYATVATAPSSVLLGNDPMLRAPPMPVGSQELTHAAVPAACGTASVRNGCATMRALAIRRIRSRARPRVFKQASSATQAGSWLRTRSDTAMPVIFMSPITTKSYETTSDAKPK